MRALSDKERRKTRMRRKMKDERDDSDITELNAIMSKGLRIKDDIMELKHMHAGGKR